MRKLFYGTLATVALAFGSTAPETRSVASDPDADADCLIALLALADEADGDDEDAIISVAMYYFGRLGGEGYANETYVLSRIGRFVDNESLYLTEAQSCLTDFETETKKLENLAKVLDD